MTFKEMAPFVIVVTLIISILIAMKIKKKEILTIDGLLSILGFGLGLIITFVNLIYSNNYMIALGPILAIASVLYLRFRNKILTNRMNIDFDMRTLKVINILYWVCILIAIISYRHAPDRPPIFFGGISFGVTLLGLDILSSRFKDDFKTFGMIFKILLVSLILRSSAYFISPYPIGIDPWNHADLINDISKFGTLNIPTSVAEYYSNYPLMHIYAVFMNLIGNVDIKGSMFIIGIVLTLSTVFIYLLVKNITGNINLALLSMLILNFSDFHIQWFVEVIAMSFGIAIYMILLYLIMRNEKHQILNTLFLIMFFFTIIWTHTVSGFIEMISIISLYIGSLAYKLIYKKRYVVPLFNFTFCMVFIILLLYHWMDPKYPFLDDISNGLVNSLSSKAKFLGRSDTSNYIGGPYWNNILDIAGFLIYIFFGIIGVYCSTKRFANKAIISLIIMLIVLFFIFFTFPVFALRNIAPYRWPAFIYVSLAIFTGIGLVAFLCILESRYLKVAFIMSILFISSFFMITNRFANMDSPIYAKELNQNFILSESEMKLFENINKTFDGIIIGDQLAINVIFWSYFRRDDAESYLSNAEEDIHLEYMDNKLILRRERFSMPIKTEKKIKNYVDNTFSNIYDTGDARAYLKTLK